MRTCSPASDEQLRELINRLVMRACEGCRRRKIKCDAATTNTWPCSACIRLKLHCVRPNGQYDGTSSDSVYEPSGSDYADTTLQEAFRQAQAPLQQNQLLAASASKSTPAMYAAQAAYPDNPNMYQAVPYSESPATQHNLNYTTVPPSVSLIEQSYAPQAVFPSPLQQGPRQVSPADSYSQDGYQQDLADLLGSLKVNEAGTGWRNNPFQYR
jgi:hypothetical protein